MAEETQQLVISVVVADDQPSYAFGLKTLLETLSDDVRVVGVATSADEGLRLVQEHMPDLVLMDVRMPGREGVEAAKKIHQIFPSVKVVMLTVSDSPEDVGETLRAGARGYLTKDINPEELLASLRAVMADEIVLAPFAAAILVGNTAPVALRDSELHVLSLLADGKDLAQIAKDICVSESTLKRMIRGIQVKLQAENRMQAVVTAAKRGLI